jgi:hypothetical protein
MTSDELPRPLGDWRELSGPGRREWWQELWHDTIALTTRYRLPLRSGWWEDALQVEALAAFAAWVRMYDTGAYIDPDGKLKLLWQLEPLRAMLRAGEHPFEPESDYPSYQLHVAALGERVDAASTDVDDASVRHGAERARLARQRALTSELTDLLDRLRELEEREQLLRAQLGGPNRRGHQTAQPERDLAELTRTIGKLRRRHRELDGQLSETRDG